MCNLGGIVLLHRKTGWVIEEWKNGKAPSHKHFFWGGAAAIIRTPKDRAKLYPKLAEFKIGEGIMIGHRLEGLHGALPYYFLDGIVLNKE